MRKLIKLILEYPDVLTSRDSIIDMFTTSELMLKEQVIKTQMTYPGKIFTDNGKIYVIKKFSRSEGIEAEEFELIDSDRLDFQDEFILDKGMIANYQGPPVKTTLGLFLLNYAVLVKSFGDVIPYVNEEWDIGKIEDLIAEETINKAITPDQVIEYIDRIYAISGYSDLCVPAMSEKSITSNPEVNKRRAELYKQYEGQLSDPNVMINIEQELIRMDKEALKDDVSNGFLISNKNFAVQRKRMFLTIGMVESFGDSQSDFMFASTDLNSGWNLNELDILANDVRRGSFNRAKTTAKGGAESKFLGRTFQESKIVEENCGSKRGIETTLNDQNKKFFVYRTIIIGDKTLELTPENIDKYLGKTIMVRSPMFCNSKNGYCYTCMDNRFKSAGISLLNILPIAIGSAFLQNAMKSMHGKAVSVLRLDNLDEFLI